MAPCRFREQDSRPDSTLPDDEVAHLPDGQLLERYALRDHHEAFAALVQRYGALVLGVCERVLQDRHDAEDAFQATFLVLARKAARLDRGGTLGSWLHSVAFRTALKARALAARRRAHERKAAFMPAAEHSDEAAWAELRPLFDEELNHLPHKYRAPLVLCFLEGKTHLQAARELGWSSGSMSRRIERARELLRQRLTKRGVALPALLLCSLLSKRAPASTVPLSLEQSTIHAALVYGKTGAASVGLLSRETAALAEQVIRSGTGPTLRILYAVLAIAVMALGSGAALQATRQSLKAGAGRSHAASGGSCRSNATESEVNNESLEMISAIQSQGPIQALAFTHDGLLLASVSRSASEPIRFWDRKSGKERRQIVGQGGAVLALAFAPDDKILASAGDDGAVRLWRSNSGAEQAVLRGHDGSVSALCFSPDGRVLASGGSDGAIRLWQTASWRELALLKTGPISVLSYSPDGNSLAAAGRDGVVHLWQTSTGRPSGNLVVHHGPISALTFMPDGRALAVASSDGAIATWDVRGHSRLDQYLGHKGRIAGLVYVRAAGALVSAGFDGDLRAWQQGSSPNGQVIGRTNDNIRALAHAGDYLAAGNEDGRICIFQTKRQTLSKK